MTTAATTATTTTTSTAAITTTTACTAVTLSSTTAATGRRESPALRLLRAARDGHLEQLADAPAMLASLSRSARQILLVTAAHQGSAQLVGLLLAMRDIDVNWVIAGGNTALLAACESGHAEVLRRLLQAGASMAIRNKRFLTPMLLACRSGDKNTAALLIEASAGRALSDADVFGRSVLMYAASAGHASLVKYLVQPCLSSDPDAGTKAMRSAALHNQPTAILALHEAGVSIHAEDENGLTPLRAAASVYAVGSVYTLLKLGAELRVTDFTGQNALEGLLYRLDISTPNPQMVDTIIAIIDGAAKPITINVHTYQKLMFAAQTIKHGYLRNVLASATFCDHDGRTFRG